MVDIIPATEIARLLGDPTRVRILRALFDADEELCVADLADAVGSSHSATSHQLAKLESYGIVQCVRHGQKMCYTLQDNALVSRIKKALIIFSVL